MPLTYQTQCRAMTAQLSGEIDHHAARSLMRELDQAIESRSPRTLVLDMSGVSFMDSSGIAVLLRTLRRMQELGGTMEVISVPPQAGKVLRSAGVHKLIPLTFAGNEEKGAYL